MTKVWIALLLACAMIAADTAKAPTLTSDQKLKVRDAQVKVADLDRQRMALQEQFRQVQESLTKASDEFNAVIKEVTPKGYVLQMDLTLIPDTTPAVASPK